MYALLIRRMRIPIRVVTTVRRIAPFWAFQLGGWSLFWGTMVVAGLSQWPLGFTLMRKSFLTLPGFAVSLAMREMYRAAGRRGAGVPLLVAVSFPLSWGAAAVWMAIHNLLLALYVTPAVAWRRFPDFNNAIYYAVVLLAWSLLYFGVQTWLAQERDRRRLREAESMAQAAMLRALRLQLDPHFLFNALNAISTLIAEGRNGDASRMLSRVGDFLRMTLDAPGAPAVTLATEIEFAQRYLDIEQVRFGERLRVDFQVDPATSGALVPVMILQPLVENAVRHAVEVRPAGASIAISSAREEQWLTLRVADDGPGLGVTAPVRVGVGLSNTRERLERLYGSECELRVASAVDGGVAVLLRLPFQTVGAAQ